MESTLKNNSEYISLSYDTHTDSSRCALLYVDGTYKSVPVSFSQSINTWLLSTQTRTVYRDNPQRYYNYPRHLYSVSSSLRTLNAYEGFYADYTLNGLTTYPNSVVRFNWKRKHGQAHLCYGPNYRSDCRIHKARLSNSFLSSDNVITFFIKWHNDADNYWHWMFEWLPRLLLLSKYLSHRPVSLDYSNIEYVVIGNKLSTFQENSILAVLGFLPKITYCPSTYFARSSLEAPLSFTTHQDSNLINQLTDAVLASAPHYLPSQHYKRIYIKRGNARNGRNLLNEDALLNLLDQYDFKIVQPDQISIWEQAQLFLNANIIVGPHGSAFVNMIYCQPNTSVIELFASSYFSAHDFSLAYTCNLDWHPYLCQTSQVSNDFSINIEQFDEFLRTIFYNKSIQI